MTFYAAHDAEGRILSYMDCPTDQSGLAASNGWAGIVETGPDLDWTGSYVSGGTIVARPTLPDLPATVAAGVSVSVSGFPALAPVTITGPVGSFSGTATAGGAVEFQINEPGVWEVSVEPAFPVVPRTYQIEVTA